MATVTLANDLILNLEGKLVEVGDKPNVEFTSKGLEQLSLNDYKGQLVVLNIFPSVDTGICATSVREFNKIASDLNCKVLCLSGDLPFALDRFCAAEGLTNVEVCSVFRNKQSLKNLGIYITNGPLESLAARSVILLDKDGVVKYVQLVPEIKQNPDFEHAINAIKELI